MALANSVRATLAAPAQVALAARLQTAPRQGPLQSLPLERMWYVPARYSQ
ncbi:MAG TPA: hypothetical protein VHT68_22890 [Pseudolabrys sp.]|nr:hypothetical protein [Pseudolabrys sp.]